MQLASDIRPANPTIGFGLTPQNTANPDFAESRYADYKIIRRNGSVAPFEPSKIGVAMTKAFIAVNGSQEAASARMREMVQQLTGNVVSALMRHKPTGGTFHIEDVQDQVELALMRAGVQDVARSDVLDREKRAQERAQAKAQEAHQDVGINVSINGGHV
ncbi:MAG: ribonucleoside-diphosphate reductase subunit alpha, partial [Betaproteobacteria bacterium]|nr:ribonucleoside-diphosphate reductase subunit alpha [Betaproteobacteria bacterium]